jgi:hypothetical protein
LTDRTGLNAVEAEILKPDEARLIKTPEMDILDHLFLFFCWALCELCPETDSASNAIGLAIFKTLHVICFSFFIQCPRRAILNTDIAVCAEPFRKWRI